MTGDTPPDERNETDEASPHYLGHRQRLRERFLTSGSDALADYELLELILAMAVPRRDVKPLAKELLRVFGGLWPALHAPADKLRAVKAEGVSLASDVAVAAVRAVGATALRAMRQQVMNRPVLASWNALIEYCTAAMAHEPIEQFRLLFLDKRNALIADEVQQRGTVDFTPVFPREVVKRALELEATALILTHNHPSGDPTPSRADIQLTKDIVKAVGAVDIVVHDHVILGKGRHASFKALGLL